MVIEGCTYENRICVINNVNYRFLVINIPEDYANVPTGESVTCHVDGALIPEYSVLSDVWGGASPVSTQNVNHPIKDTNGSIVFSLSLGYVYWRLYANALNIDTISTGGAYAATGFVHIVIFKFQDGKYGVEIELHGFPPPGSTETYVAPTNDSYGYYVGVPYETDRTYILNSANIGGKIDLGTQIYTHSTEAPTDPYSGAGDSGTGGGGGTFSDTGDDIPIPNLPSLSAANAGFITLFNPSVSQLNALADYMWTNAAFDVANFKKIFEDPMDCILGLSIVPIQVTTSGSADVAIGNLLVPSIQFPVVSSQYQEFNCGSIPLTDLFFGGYLDYEPYTKIQIVLPYCGTFQISADDVMGKTITLVYHIDVLTGSCVAMLKCGNSVLYQFNGSCAVNIPINSINYASTIENATRIAVAIGTTVATAGAAAAPTLSAGVSKAGLKEAAIFAGNIGAQSVGATAEGALSMKPSIERSGALSSSSGMMSVQTPYIVITRPRICLPSNQDKLKGYPSFITVTLSDLEGKGYTEFDSIILENLFLTDDEKGELDNILRSGVYL